MLLDQVKVIELADRFSQVCWKSGIHSICYALIFQNLLRKDFVAVYMAELIQEWSLTVSASLSYSLQRKSNRAKEKKQRRLEERAAMDAVCAKVVAANKVHLLHILKLKVFGICLIILIVASFVCAAWRPSVGFPSVQKVRQKRVCDVTFPWPDFLDLELADGLF